MTALMRTVGLLAAGGLLFGAPRAALAERVRFHYVPAGGAVLQPTGPGERLSYFGAPLEPFTKSMRATALVTFRHAYTGGPVTVPLALPDETPRIEYVANRVVYNYGSYTVTTVFLPDGAVDVIYDSGFLRPL
jgi:hypothetical protein